MTHILHTAFFLPLSIERVFAFFSEAGNLERITPPELNFHIRPPQPEHITTGTLIDYRLRLLGWPFAWRTEISAWDPPHRFIDRQLEGPYRRWEHTQRFTARAGGTFIEDEVRYELPLWPLGELVYPLVHLQLQRIFRFRERAIRGILLG